MGGAARDAEKQRRRAEALRSNLKRRKAAREGRGADGQRPDEAEPTQAPPPGSIEGD